MDAERSSFIRSRGNYAAALGVSTDNYRLSLERWFKRLLHGNEEGIQINMENTASHETVYKLAHRVDKANLQSQGDTTMLTVVAYLYNWAFYVPLTVIWLHLSTNLHREIRDTGTWQICRYDGTFHSHQSLGYLAPEEYPECYW
jgi:hypothetical protein